MEGAVITVGGPGRENAARAAEKLAANHRLTGLVSAGFAGALSPVLKIGDLVVDTEVPRWREVAQASQAAQASMPADVGRPGGLPHPELGRRGRLPHIHLGRIVTVDHLIRSTGERQQLARETGALAVDMESEAVAAVAARLALPFAAIRAITDTADHDLVIDWDRCRRLDGTFRLASILARALSSRGGVAEILRFWYASRLASKNLGFFVGALLSREVQGSKF
jgi:nucleoside phosphorylase